jgi:hypothetical protein
MGLGNGRVLGRWERRLRSFLWFAAIPVAVALGAGSVAAQPVIPSKAGLIDYVEGIVFLGQRLLPSPLVAEFPYIAPNAFLRSVEGRAETLLGPDLFLRLGRNCSVRMIDNRVVAPRVELIAGSAVAELAEGARLDGFSIHWKGVTAEIAKAGVYRFDTAPARIKVFSGRARVTIAGMARPIEVPGGKMLLLADSGPAALQFDRSDMDRLDRWSQWRDGVLASEALRTKFHLTPWRILRQPDIAPGQRNGSCLACF